VPLSRKKNTCNATQICYVGIHKSGTLRTLARGWRGGQPFRQCVPHAHNPLSQCTALAPLGAAPHSTHQVHAHDSNADRSSSPVLAINAVKESDFFESCNKSYTLSRWSLSAINCAKHCGCVLEGRVVRVLVERVIMRLSLTVIVGAGTALTGEAVSQPHAIPWGPLK
jgi:hypothetical protein